MGQFLSFRSKTEPEWASYATEYFEKSLEVFVNKTYIAMSINFLATLSWQLRDLHEACQWMECHSGVLKGIIDRTTFWECIGLLAEEKRTFDVTNMLRIASLRVKDDILFLEWTALEKLIRQIQLWPDEHPKELALKWGGFLLALNRSIDDAIRMADLSIAVSDKGSFTLRTLAILPCCLKAWCLIMQGKVKLAKAMLENVETMIIDFNNEEPGFQRFIESAGGAKALTSLIDGKTLDALYDAMTFLPFSYS